ncbi:MAG: phosphoribosylanthranilate isomerase [Oscillospiraceae bacterium]|jgi:phosphoribosylanthranilate isomerase|nr:phosphoribosylanthranilate isomerase [Oscillospiraceae bacterium]
MVKLKICGLTRDECVDAVNAALPDYAGFVFADGSRRRVEPERAARLQARLDPRITPVGVFVNADSSLISSLYDSGTIAIAQLHGGEDGAYIAELKRRGIPVIQVIRATRGDVANALADYHLYDGADGGSGAAFDHSTVIACGKPVFIAGGLNASNIRDALRLNPFAVDVSSGAESGGVKDAAKIKRLVEIVRYEA